MRVVSLTCSNTEIVDFLGLSELLVGVDDHSDYPVELVNSLPRVGPDLGIDVDRVLELKPDLVLASLTVPGHERVVEAIDRAGLQYLAPAPKSIRDVASNIQEIAAALGEAERGRRLAAQFNSAIEDCPRIEDHRHRPSVLVQWWPKPVIAPGALSWVQGLLDSCGATNPLSGEQVESRPLEDSEVAALDPDVIVLSWCGVEAHKVRPDVVLGNPAFASVKAVQNRSVVCIPEAWLGRPSPRLAWGWWAVEQVVEAVSTGGPMPESLASPSAVAELLRGSGPWPPASATPV